MMHSEIEIKALYKAPDHAYKGRHGKGSLDIPMEECQELKLIAGSGIMGDRYFNHKPDFKGQITFFSWDVFMEVQEKFSLPTLEAHAFRRNVLVKGVDLNSLIGKEFTIGEVTFTGSEEAAPCYWMDEACAPGTESFLKGQGGLRCRVVSRGDLCLGTTHLKCN